MSFRHTLKAAGMVDGVIGYLRDLGCTTAELKSAVRQMRFIQDHLGRVMPDMIAEPSRPVFVAGT